MTRWHATGHAPTTLQAAPAHAGRPFRQPQSAIATAASQEATSGIEGARPLRPSAGSESQSYATLWRPTAPGLGAGGMRGSDPYAPAESYRAHPGVCACGKLDVVCGQLLAVDVALACVARPAHDATLMVKRQVLGAVWLDAPAWAPPAVGRHVRCDRPSADLGPVAPVLCRLLRPAGPASSAAADSAAAQTRPSCAHDLDAQRPAAIATGRTLAFVYHPLGPHVKPCGRVGRGRGRRCGLLGRGRR
jgi:hypothetical protein